jgi:hypothetical protein
VTWVYPHIFQDDVNEIASGVQVNENFNAAKTAIEANEPALKAVSGLGHKVAWGTGSLTKEGGQNESLPAVITHGLGTTPIIAIVQGTHHETADQPVAYTTYSYTSSQFSVVAYGGVTAYAATFVWIAIG